MNWFWYHSQRQAKCWLNRQLGTNDKSTLKSHDLRWASCERSWRRDCWIWQGSQHIWGLVKYDSATFLTVLLDMMSLQKETGLAMTKEEHTCGIFLDANSVNKNLEVGCSKTQALAALSWLWRNCYLWAAGAQRYGLQESTNAPTERISNVLTLKPGNCFQSSRPFLESQAFCQ